MRSMVAVCRRLIAPNVQKKVFLPGGATATSTSAVQVSDLTCDSDKQIYFKCCKGEIGRIMHLTTRDERRKGEVGENHLMEELKVSLRLMNEE